MDKWGMGGGEEAGRKQARHGYRGHWGLEVPLIFMAVISGLRGGPPLVLHSHRGNAGWPRLHRLMGIMPHLWSPNRLSCYLTPLLRKDNHTQTPTTTHLKNGET